MNANISRTMLTLACVATFATSYAVLPKAIFTNIASSPTSLVPGLGGIRFKTGVTSQFDRPFYSPDGSRWVIHCLNNAGTSSDDMIVEGSGTSGATGSVVAREGSAAPGLGGFIYGIFRQGCAVNDQGNVAYSADTNAATTADDVVYVWRRATNIFEIFAREGTQAVGQPSGIGYGLANNSCNLSNTDELFFRSASFTGTTADQALFRLTNISTGSVIAQRNITIPGNQLVAPPQVIENFTTEAFAVDATGANQLYSGDMVIPIATDAVVVFNGNVVVQEGAIVPGSSFTSLVATANFPNDLKLAKFNGHYTISGSNVDLQDWVLHDGAVVAKTDAPIMPSSTELYDDALYSPTFFAHAANSNGDYVIGGVTNNSDTSRNAVLILNGNTEILREGDPVDINGDGLANDNAFVSVFNDHDMQLNDQGQLLLCMDLKDSAGVSLGQGMFVLELAPTPAVPSGYQVNFGVETTVPGVERLQSNDADTVQLCLNSDQEDPAPVQLEFSTTFTNLNPSQMKIGVVCRAEATDREIYNEFFSFNLGDWVGVPSVPITDADALYEFIAPGAGSNYVNQSNGQVIGRITGLLGAADVPTLPCWDFNSISWF